MSKKKTILLVEDEVLIAMSEKMELEKYGYTVHHVITGEIAVTTIYEEVSPIDLILMDIDLGSGIDGTQAAEQILNHRDLPIVFLSSHTEPEVVQKTEKITSYGYVVKNSGIIVIDASIKMALKLFDAKTERKRAEEALRESEERYRLIAENAGDNISIYDLNLRCTYSSPAVERMLGYTPQEIVGESVEARLTPDSLAQARQAFEEEIRLETGGNADPARKVTLVSEEYHKNGSIIWVEDTFSFLRDADGRPTAILSVSRDITERKRAEETQLKLALVAQNSSELINMSSLDGTMTFLNEAGSRMLGISPLEVDRHSIMEVIPEHLRGLVQNELLPTLIEKGRWEGDLQYRNIQTGQLTDVHAMTFTIKNAKTGATQFLANVSLDITEQKQAEKALKESEETLHKSLEFSPIPIAVAKNNGDLIFINKQFVETYGYALHELVSIHKWFEIVYPDIEYRNFVLQDWSSNVEFAIKNNIPTPVKEYSVTCKNGDIKTIEISAFFEKDYSIGLFNNITERKQAEEEIKKQLTEKEVLLLEVHHRVKNNIANIEALLSLQAGSTSNPEVINSLQQAISRVQSMRVLYDKLLLSEDYHDISMKSYTENLIDSLLSVFVFENNIRIEKQIADFIISPKKAIPIGMIINELLTNVFKYAFIGRDNGTVSISIEINENIVTLTIKDNGVGIDESSGSTGFGLTIVTMLVKQLRGAYSVVNENGTKSVIQFEI